MKNICVLENEQDLSAAFEGKIEGFVPLTDPEIQFVFDYDMKYVSLQGKNNCYKLDSQLGVARIIDFFAAKLNINIHINDT